MIKENFRFSHYFLYLTILALPFSIRKIFWHEKASTFQEYSDGSLFLFEIFAILFIATLITEHKSYYLSIIKKMFHVEHLIIFLLFCSSSIIFAISTGKIFPVFLLFKWVLYGTFIVALFSFIREIVPRGTINKKITDQDCSTWNNLSFIILLSLFIQAVIILFQVLTQKSIGLYILGEGILSPAIAGVSTIIIGSKEYLRGYGTFLHPNQAAFFLISYAFLYILTIIVPRGTILKQISAQKQINCSTWNKIIQILKEFTPKMFHVEHSQTNKNVFMNKIVPRGTIFFIYICILLALIFTFSKAILTLVLLSLFVLFFQCSTWNTSAKFRRIKMFHVEHFENKRRIDPRGTLTVVTITILLSIGYFFWTTDYIQQSILERKSQYLSIPNIGLAELLRGQGLGSYTYLLSEKSPGLYQWQIQPIHNAFILAIYELGLITFSIIALFLYRNMRKVLSKPLFFSQKIILTFMFGLFLLLNVDHYLWDLEQTQFLFIVLFWVFWRIFRLYPNTLKGV